VSSDLVRGAKLVLFGLHHGEGTPQLGDHVEGVLLHGETDGHDACNLRVKDGVADGAPGAEGVAHQQAGPLRQQTTQPLHGGADVVHLAAALVVGALAAAHPAEVEAQRGEPGAIQGAVGVEQHRVPHGASVHGVGMGKDRAGAVFAQAQRRLQPTGRAGDPEAPHLTHAGAR